MVFIYKDAYTKPVIINFIYYDVNKTLGVGSLKNNEYFSLQFLTGFDSGFINVELCFHLPEDSLLLWIKARILEWVAMPSSRGSSDPGIEPMSFISSIGRQVLYS